ncbi:hypothetical protein MRB53_005175 [Persea americana]|uniref:Uncharacterized protein n=1 Tax=Persea americana TaxID=3435 RepID=A0ACC2ME41_PERAE|nr:hypothetical protein MRB53_005175 [Persea americana]
MPFSHGQRQLIEAKPIVYKYKAEGSKVLMQSTAIALFCNPMDSIFFLEDEARARFLQAMGQAIGCTYICLWSYLPPPQNYLISMDAWYNVEMDQPSSSTGSLFHRLFDEYRRSLFNVEYGCVPGHAFREGMPFLEQHYLELMRWVSNETQRWFYQINMQLEIRKLLAKDFFQEYQLKEPYIMDQIEHENIITRTSPIQSHSQAMQLGDIQLLKMTTSGIAAITNTILAGLSSPSSSCQREESNTLQCQIGDGTGAFVSYASSIVPRMESRLTSHGQFKMKLVFAMLGSIYSTMREAKFQEKHPTSNRLRHIFSERMRRRKFKECFQALRSLLPPDSKKDQLSVLVKTLDYLNALKARVLELQGRNQRIAVHLSPAKEAQGEVGDMNEAVEMHGLSGNESTPAYQQINLRVTVSKNDCDMVDLVFHLLECLKQMEEKLSIVSMQADTELHHMNQFNQAIFRLRIKTSEWDERLIKEALIKAVDDLTR